MKATGRNWLAALCVGGALASFSPFAWAVTYYDGFTAFAAATCSTASGGSISTGTRSVQWNTPAGGGTETRVDYLNGVPHFSPPPYSSPAGSGTGEFGSFGAIGLGAYPFTYAMTLTTSEGETIDSVSVAYIRCTATGPAKTTFVLASVPGGPVTPAVGLWWNATESGSGYAIDVKHGVIVVTIYSYTSGGDAQWYITSGPIVGNTFVGTINKYENGQCISCPYAGLPSSNADDGVVVFIFYSPTSATLYLPAWPGGRVTNIEPQPF